MRVETHLVPKRGHQELILCGWGKRKGQTQADEVARTKVQKKGRISTPLTGTAVCKSWEGSQARDRSVRKVRGRGMAMKMGEKEGWDGFF